MNLMIVLLSVLSISILYSFSDSIMANHKAVIEKGTLRHRLKIETKSIHSRAEKRLRQILFEDPCTTRSLKFYKSLLLQVCDHSMKT